MKLSKVLAIVIALIPIIMELVEKWEGFFSDPPLKNKPAD